MKLPTLFLASALVFLFTSPSLSSRTTPENDVVLDSQGNPLETSASYYISSIYWGAGGGEVDVVTGTGNNGTCEQYVIQLPGVSLLPGSLFTFTPVAIPIGEEAVRLRAPLAIKSLKENPCGESSILKVSSDTGIPVPILTTGGFFNTPNSCLRISKPDFVTFPHAYVLEHCPNVCGAAEKLCYPVGIYTSNGSKYLSTKANQFFQVTFIKNSLVNMS